MSLLSSSCPFQLQEKYLLYHGPPGSGPLTTTFLSNLISSYPPSLTLFNHEPHWTYQARPHPTAFVPPGPSTWNALSLEIHMAHSLTSFGSLHKCHFLHEPLLTTLFKLHSYVLLFALALITLWHAAYVMFVVFVYFLTTPPIKQ